MDTKLPNSYMKWSIVNAIICFCCTASNLNSLKYSFKTENDIEKGDFIQAKKHSKLAFKFNLITNIYILIGFFVCILIYILKDIILNYFIIKML